MTCRESRTRPATSGAATVSDLSESDDDLGEDLAASLSGEPVHDVRAHEYVSPPLTPITGARSATNAVQQARPVQLFQGPLPPLELADAAFNEWSPSQGSSVGDGFSQPSSCGPPPVTSPQVAAGPGCAGGQAHKPTEHQHFVTASGKKRRRVLRWEPAEVETLIAGIRETGWGSWAPISAKLPRRTAVDVKDKANGLCAHNDELNQARSAHYRVE